MTYVEYKDSGQSTSDIGGVIGCDDLSGRSGMVYESGGWIEDTSDWDSDSPGYGCGRWYSIVGNMQYQSDDIDVVLRPVYEFHFGG